MVYSARFSADHPRYLDLHFDHYVPNRPKNVALIIATGMVEHRKHYTWLASSLCTYGYDVFVLDHRGHGQSVLEDSDEISWGEMGENGFEHAVLDLAKLARVVHTTCPKHKRVLLGHSMGSLLARRLIQHDYVRLDALILTGTPTPFRGLKWCARLARGLHALHCTPRWNLSVLFSLHPRVRAFGRRGAWLCKDPKVLKRYHADKASRFTFSMNSFACLLEGTHLVFSAHAYGDKNLPILLMSGLEDVCGGFGVGVIKAYNALCAQGFKQVSLALLEQGRHKIFDEPEKQEALEILLAWLDKHQL
ncbi:alpha/beta fold hydrolase [Helicobacter baculiformis]|uniref:Alpha/beta fold hydrolase n=1 Tax=Helicobacter baculiformis TaxID=427351 RepID=A0ABV7ZJ29_9HELI|nr:alpha/beta hydrolase [Helicobacter baculiformis]